MNRCTWSVTMSKYVMMSGAQMVLRGAMCAKKISQLHYTSTNNPHCVHLARQFHDSTEFTPLAMGSVLPSFYGAMLGG